MERMPTAKNHGGKSKTYQNPESAGVAGAESNQR